MKFSIIGLVCCLLVSSSFQTDSFVDPNVVLLDNFEGWGTSLAWWGDVVGGMDQEIVDHVVDAVFSPSKLNFNIARYVIGGTTPGNHTCGEYRAGAATESFKDGPDSAFNWNRDLRQRKILQMAKATGADYFEAFSNTPPQWMTISGCSKGNPGNFPLRQNFDESNSEIFADYATEVIKYFHEELNITFSTYSPFNEPYGLHGIGGWLGPSQTQEGCNIDRPTMVSVINSMNEAITAKNMDFLKIAIADETQVNTQILTYEHFVDAGISDRFQKVNVHGYWEQAGVSRKDLLNLRSKKNGHSLWMDEMGWGGSPPENMEQGLNVANRIVSDFKMLIPSAWVYWQVVEGIGGWGLLNIPFENPTIDSITFNSGYYAMEQFSQHIKKGYKLVYTSDKNTVAALSGDMSKLVIVIVNPGTESASHEIDLNLLESFGNLNVYRTSPTEQHLNLPPPLASQNKVKLECPPQSVSTIEISDVTIATSRENLLENGGFESILESDGGKKLPTSWTLTDSRNRDIEAVSEYDAWRGSFSGFLEIGPRHHATLHQSFNSSSSCVYYLSAWCLSDYSGTSLGVKVNGGHEQEVTITSNEAYNSYGISFAAGREENVEVYFVNRGTGTLLSGFAKIDDVQVHAICF